MQEDQKLTELEKKILDFEAKYEGDYGNGIKPELIHKEFEGMFEGSTAIRYYQKLNWIIEKEGALEYNPTLVKRLLRVRETHLMNTLRE